MALRNCLSALAAFVAMSTTTVAFCDELESAKEAIRLKEFAAAADQLNVIAGKQRPAAQYLLGTLYLSGLGVTTDVNKARQLFEASAAQGEPRAAFALSAMLANDEPRDLVGAHRWLDRAAELRFPPAIALRKEGVLPFNTKDALAASDADVKREMARLAATQDDVGTLKALLASVAVNDADEFGRTLLHRAAENGAALATALLIQEHAIVDAVDQFGVTPLMLAATRSSSETLQLLLAAHANTKVTDRSGNTALFYAARNDRVDHIKTMIASGFDVSTRNANGWSAIDYAAQANAKNALSYLQGRGVTLVRHMASTSTRSNGDILRAQGKIPDLYTPWSDLAIAVSRDDPALVQSMMERGTKVSGENEFERLLTVAAITQAPKSATTLLSARDKLKTSIDEPLVIAIKHGNVDLVRALLSGGAISQTKSGLALFTAIRSNQPAIAALLLESGVNANASENEYTALMMAAQRGQMQSVEALLSANAEVNHADKNGRTALWYASNAGEVSVVETLLKHQANIDVADKEAVTPLLQAAAQGHARVVESLLSAKADPGVRTKRGDTALTLAAASGHQEVTQMLIAAKIDLDAQTASGDTALIYASRAGYEQIVSTLLQAGASSKLRNKEKISAEDVAHARGFDQIAKLIEKS